MNTYKQITVDELINTPHYINWSDSRINRRVKVKNGKLVSTSYAGTHLIEPVVNKTDARLDVILGKVKGDKDYQVIDGNSRKWVATQCKAMGLDCYFGGHKLNAICIEFDNLDELHSRFLQHDNKNAVDIANDSIAYGLNGAGLDDTHPIYGIEGMASALKLVGKSLSHVESVKLLTPELMQLQAIPYDMDVIRGENKKLWRSSVKAAILELMHNATHSGNPDECKRVVFVINQYMNQDKVFSDLQNNLRGTYYKGVHWSTIKSDTLDALKYAYTKKYKQIAPSKPPKKK